MSTAGCANSSNCRRPRSFFPLRRTDIDKMVEEYRQALLIRKLDQPLCRPQHRHDLHGERDRGLLQRAQGRFPARPYVGQGTDRAVRRRVPPGAQIAGADGGEERSPAAGFRDICAKNDFTVTDFSDQWVDFPEFLSFLPTLRSQNYVPVLASTAVQEMRDSHSHYYFQIDAVRREGEPTARTAPGDDPPHPLQSAPERDHPQPRGGTL